MSAHFHAVNTPIVANLSLMNLRKEAGTQPSHTAGTSGGVAIHDTQQSQERTSPAEGESPPDFPMSRGGQRREQAENVLRQRNTDTLDWARDKQALRVRRRGSTVSAGYLVSTPQDLSCKMREHSLLPQMFREQALWRAPGL